MRATSISASVGIFHEMTVGAHCLTKPAVMTLSVPRCEKKETVVGSPDTSTRKGCGTADAPRVKKTPIQPEETDQNDRNKHNCTSTRNDFLATLPPTNRRNHCRRPRWVPLLQQPVVLTLSKVALDALEWTLGTSPKSYSVFLPNRVPEKKTFVSCYAAGFKMRSRLQD